MVSREKVEGVLSRVRPLLQADGGDVELVSVQEKGATVRLTGNCVGCPSAQLTLHLGIETALKEAMPEFDVLQVV
jgi:Fe-S cluster biogenesis protein NfuA